MSNTIVSIFPDISQAEQAKIQLLASGISQDQISIKKASYKEENPDTRHEQEGFIDQVKAFFENLFGADDHQVEHFASAARSGTIITVHTENSDTAAQVADLLDSYGAADVNETSGSYFPQSDDPDTQRHFADDPSAGVINKQEFVENDLHARSARIKSRIIQRRLDNTADESFQS